MAPPKAQRASDFFRQGRRDKTRPEQDGGGSHSPTPASDQGSNTEALQPPPGDISLSEAKMAAMLQKLRSSMKEDLQLAVDDIRREVHEVGTRLNALEEKTDDLCQANDGILDKIRQMESEQARLTAKLADLEDRSRRNNIRVRGVPESVAGSDIPEYLRQLFTAIQPNLEPADLRLDRAHRVPKPATLARDIPRDIVTRLHYFSAKDAILTAQRKSTAMPPGYEKISLFADLSPMTMARRRDFINVTKCLRNHKIPYRWGFPTKLLIWRNGTLTKLEDPDQGMHKLKAWGLFPDHAPPNHPASPGQVTQEWTKVKRKK
ncbi:Hypothetical predicted protein [Pelobates cultripes]|uniref:L1 transposable element RRM domain-containing protein n=1 Tax=Pelobates cultripes TaxID=61616 RepID=A0AAD1RGI0_PELCU|nr:Hypothetical predicted protein [Pelobates cultripes]